MVVPPSIISVASYLLSCHVNPAVFHIIFRSIDGDRFYSVLVEMVKKKKNSTIKRKNLLAEEKK